VAKRALRRLEDVDVQKVVFDIPNQMVTVPAKAGRSLDERVILRSFKEVGYHRSLPWIELTVAGKPARWKNEQAFRDKASGRFFRLGRMEIKNNSAGVWDRYVEAIHSEVEVRQMTGRVEGWSFKPNAGGKDPAYEEEPDRSDVPPLLLLTEFQIKSHK